MATNVGTIDLILRIIVGLILIAFAIPLGLPQTGWNWIGWIGVVPLLRASFGFAQLTAYSDSRPARWPANVAE